MKKIASLLMAALMLATMLTAFAVPASAEDWNEDLTLSGTKTFDEGIYADCDVTIESGASIIFKNSFKMSPNHTLTIKRGASVTYSGFAVKTGCTLIIERGASVTCGGIFHIEIGSTAIIERDATVKFDKGFNMENGSTLIIESGASVTCGEDFFVEEEGSVTIENGATLTVDGQMTPNFTLNLGGTLIVNGNIMEIEKFNFLPGMTVDLTNLDEFLANTFFEQLQECTSKVKCVQTEDGSYRVTAHIHLNPEAGNCCGYDFPIDSVTDGTGSILSEGSLTIICSVVCLAVGFLAAMFIFKKKKPALASGENKDEE